MKLFAGFFKHDRYNPDGTKQQPGKAGVKVVSALKDIDMVALKDAVNLLAKMNININSDKIEITASDKLELKGGTSKITLTAGGIQHSTAGSWSVKCGSHSVKGPGGGSAPVSVPGVSERGSSLGVNNVQNPKFTPVEPGENERGKGHMMGGGGSLGGVGSEPLEFHLFDPDGEPMPDEKYILTLKDGTTREGNLDGDGYVCFADLTPSDVKDIQYPDAMNTIKSKIGSK
jgi:hypothetical protein